jgi:hypothetical protein
MLVLGPVITRESILNIATLEHFNICILVVCPLEEGLEMQYFYVLINQFTAVAMQNHEAVKLAIATLPVDEEFSLPSPKVESAKAFAIAILITIESGGKASNAFSDSIIMVGKLRAACTFSKSLRKENVEANALRYAVRYVPFALKKTFAKRPELSCGISSIPWPRCHRHSPKKTQHTH